MTKTNIGNKNALNENVNEGLREYWSPTCEKVENKNWNKVHSEDNNIVYHFEGH